MQENMKDWNLVKLLQGLLPIWRRFSGKKFKQRFEKNFPVLLVQQEQQQL